MLRIIDWPDLVELDTDEKYFGSQSVVRVHPRCYLLDERCGIWEVNKCLKKRESLSMGK